jgi:hypothetical protein
MDSKPSAQSPCNVCGSNSFGWGGIPSYYTTNPYAIINTGGRKMSARLCLTCGAIQLFLLDAVKETLEAMRQTANKPKRG